ncbi:MAG: agmatine deiminase family protein [Chthoniobacterales bacterium]
MNSLQPLASSLQPKSAFHMPAEWEPHEATWISWPHPQGVSFPGRYNEVIPTFVAMAEAIGASEIVRINVLDTAEERSVRLLLEPRIPKEHLEFYHIPTQEPWCRDHGPIFVRPHSPNTTSSLAILDWDYNAWGKKYLPYDLDNAVPRTVAAILKLPSIQPEMVLEGGSIDVNGAGALLTTQSCLLHKNRNPHLTQKQIEEKLQCYLGVTHIYWLGDGIEGDDTDGHIDDITRFVNEETVITMIENNHADPNHLPLQKNCERLKTFFLPSGKPLRIVELPMPPHLEREGQRLPASYANFYITNTSVLLPIFKAASDAIAVDILSTLFPTRTVLPIDCRELIWGLGAFHCLTQQVPVHQ